ncbi:MAG TPA: hypothetical protein VE843_18525, partial [Ktedonobacteraceae bacterium]|nr:hypothetical protein [Ktedonobacteraceae bacterium]
VFYRTAGAHVNFLTVRGEHATYQGYGLYYYDPASVAGEGIIWDVIDLCLALPLSIIALVLTWRGSLRGKLLLGGMLFYFFYKYMQYAVMLAFNPLFLVYVAIFALSAVAFFVNLGGIEVSRLPLHISSHFPRWLFIVFTLVMSAALIALWLGRIIPYTLAGRFPDELAGLTTLVTQAFDLGIVVPLLISTAILLWRSSIWGYFLGGVSLTFGFVMCITLPAWIVVPLIQVGQMNIIEAVPFLLLCLIGLFVAGRFFWCVREKEKVSSQREMVAVH